MSEKRALIVDDSKSARVVLSRMLEKYDLAVDTSDSAEHALEYLKAHRPDVIFMDHLMPGMDGLAAVQAIRSNPDTSAIPIMMYTSQEGELYLGQARALGATGVLPKRIGSTEVSRILQDLRLLDVPAGSGAAVASIAAGPLSGPIVVTTAGAAEAPAPAPASGGADVPGTPASASGASAPPVGATAAPPAAPAPATQVIAVEDLQRMLEPLLKQHSADLRRFVVASLDSFAARVVTETRDAPRPVAVEAAVSPPPASAPGSGTTSAPACAPAPAEAEPAARPTVWIAVATAASIAALAAGAFALHQQRQIDTLAAALASPARPALVAAPAAAPASSIADAPADGVAPSSGTATVEPAPVSSPPPAIAPAAFAYGALPFADAGLDRLAAVLAELEQRGARGVLTATLHAGDFCLTGNPAEGYALAPDEMPADRCDVVGNPHYDGLRAAQRQGAGYADLVAALRARSAGALDVRVVDAGRQGAVAAYPSGGGASAQQWNAAAVANQRIEFAFAPSAGAAGAAP